MLAVVCGGGGFIGGHLVRRLINDGCTVRSVDIKEPQDWHQRHSDADNITRDLRKIEDCQSALLHADVVYNLAADMGGMGFIENNKAACMLSVLINTHLLQAARERGVQKYFYASSACVYPAYAQEAGKHHDDYKLKEINAYPAMPEDGYGWEKLFSERMCYHFREDFGLDTRVARFHNVYGSHGTYEGGREKAPAAICRKVIEAKRSGKHEIEIWGDGSQLRSFMHVGDCVDGVRMLVEGPHAQPINIGSEEMVSINELVTIVEEIAGVTLERKYKLDAPKGVAGRCSDNTVARAALGWEPLIPLRDGMQRTYEWIDAQMSV